jgi:hypothetical protein
MKVILSLYNRTMPDIEALMQQWPPEYEDLLKEVNINRFYISLKYSFFLN